MSGTNWAQGGAIRTVDTYQDLPFFGQPQEIYFCTDMDKLVVWDADKEDWHIVTSMYGEDAERYIIDEQNDRRGAIMAQRAKKANR